MKNLSFSLIIFTNDIEIEDFLKVASEKIIKKTAQWLSEESGWIIELVDKHYLNIGVKVTKETVVLRRWG